MFLKFTAFGVSHVFPVTYQNHKSTLLQFNEKKANILKSLRAIWLIKLIVKKLHDFHM